MNALASCIYEGRVRHRRYLPRPHDFSYSMFMMYLDLDELPMLFDGRWLWSNEGTGLAQFRRRDHDGDPSMSLGDHVRNLVERESGIRPTGAIRLLTHLRYFGHIFNPVSFYYCMDAAGERVESIVAEVSNTPWREMYSYVLHSGMNGGDSARLRFRFLKAFHVSPFMDMKQEYHWSFAQPSKALAIHMENHEGDALLFDATMNLHRVEITPANLARALALHPPMTAKVVAAIYWNALRLWIRRTPFFAHPVKRIPNHEAPKP
ncbi:MAG: DUF1365 domain-containing protein [Candidatus Sumerlaeota bacterium]